MNQEISSLSSSHKLSSKKIASKAAEQPKEIAASKEIKQFKVEMEQINRALVLTQEIRHSLESALNNLNPQE